jgi:hypothetical protein
MKTVLAISLLLLTLSSCKNLEDGKALTKNTQEEDHQTSVIVIEKVPLFDQMYSVSEPESKIAVKKIAAATATFYIEWITNYGDVNDKILDNLDNLSILWGSELQVVENVYDVNGVFMPKGYASGLAYGPQLIWVWAEDGKISQTSFIHELVHVALWSHNSHGDADHEGNEKVLWTKHHTQFIDNVNELLRESDL